MASPNEDIKQLLAGAALKGAQAVAKVRLGMIVLLFLIPRITVFLTGETIPGDPVRAVASSLYVLYALWMLWQTRRAQPDPHRVLWGQVLQTLLDFSYFAFVGWRLLVVQGHINTTRTAAGCALLMCFSLVSYSRLHVVLSTGLAVLTLSGVLLISDTFSGIVAAFAACCYLSLGWLILGGSEQSEYTVIGDAVNVASRIEGLTKGLGVDILVSESTWQQGQGQFTGRRLAEEKVKGRAEAVVVYSLDG